MIRLTIKQGTGEHTYHKRLLRRPSTNDLSGAGLIDRTHGAYTPRKKPPEEKKVAKDECPGRYTREHSECTDTDEGKRRQRGRRWGGT